MELSLSSYQVMTIEMMRTALVPPAEEGTVIFNMASFGCVPHVGIPRTSDRSRSRVIGADYLLSTSSSSTGSSIGTSGPSSSCSMSLPATILKQFTVVRSSVVSQSSEVVEVIFGSFLLLLRRL